MLAHTRTCAPAPRWARAYFFIAYAAPDAAVAERLYCLLAMESTVFLDRRSLRLGDDWDRELVAAQRRAEITVVLVSDHTEEGFYQREEIATAIDIAQQDRTGWYRFGCRRQVRSTPSRTGFASSKAWPCGTRAT